MNYPVWQLGALGGGLLIAVIAVVHVFVSHFAVGGGLFLVWTERKARQENSPEILAYVKTHSRFFLLLTMVFGGLTGVAIWFTVALLNPAATSVLIHNFVFGWAIEWVFFLGEIVALLIYYTTFDKMASSRHQIIGWLYFIFAWLSLFTINGIIGFMLTPGQWLTTGNFWDGYFNPTFWPQLFLRTFLSLMLAGLYGFVTASRLPDETLRDKMVSYCAKWLFCPFVFFLASAYWYGQALPVQVQNLFFHGLPELVPYFTIFIAFTVLLFVGGVIMAICAPGKVGQGLAFVLLAIGLIYMGSFEFIREGGRRPYIIYDYMYSTSILKKDVATIEQSGLLAAARWTEVQKITPANQLLAGKELYRLSCLPCHSVGGPLKDIRKFTHSYTREGLAIKIGKVGRRDGYMAPFLGNEQERQALAAYIVDVLNAGGQSAAAVSLPPTTINMPPYDAATAPFLLLAWSQEGVTEGVETLLFSLGQAQVTVQAYLLRRDETPELVGGEGFELFCYPQGAPDAVRPLVFAEESNVFHIDLPTSSLADLPQPAPFVLEAYQDGKLLARTKVLARSSGQLGCFNCHGGRKGKTLFTDKTAENILTTHDRLSATFLLRQAREEGQVACVSCHNHGGEQLALSAAIHGFHATYMQDLGAEACGLCHAGVASGQFLTGLHGGMGLDCTSCHGGLAKHALSLLATEVKQSKEAAVELRKILIKGGAEEKIKARQAYEQEPDCLNCHVDFQEPQQGETFNQWTAHREELFSQRGDEVGLRCPACHGSPHSIFPQEPPQGELAGNLAPRQYQGNNLPLAANKGCALVCHTVDMEMDFHHPNSYRMFRNQ